MTGIPAAVAHQIATRTGLDPRVGRRAKAGACRTCSAPVLRGLDDDMCAFYVTTDIHRLTPVGELLCVLADRRTFTLDSPPPELNSRPAHRIRAFPAERHVVLAEHLCGAPPLPAMPEPPIKSPRRKGVDDAPPF